MFLFVLDFTYAFASLFTVLGNIVIFIALMSIFRIEVNTSFVPVLIASVCFLVTNMIIVFDRIREASNETNYVMLIKNYVLK